MKFLKQMVVLFVALVLLSMAVGCGNKRISDSYATDERNEMAGDSYTAEAGNGVVDRELEEKVAEHYEENHINSYDDDEEYPEDDYDYEGEESDEDATADTLDTNEDKAENIESKADDPYALYRVSEEWIKEMSGMAVERNGVLYSLSGQVPQAVLDDYGVGYANGKRGLEDKAYLFMYDQEEITDVPTASTETLITAGDFSLIKVNRSEQVRLYSTSTTDYVGIVPTEQVGYTIEAITHSDSGMYSPVLDDTMIGGQIIGNNPSVCDMVDTPVADVHDLEYGQKYKYIWYEGTEYHEMTLTADCKCYDWPTTNPLDSRVINLPVILGKDGYATVDFSGVAPGIYYIMFGGAVIEVE